MHDLWLSVCQRGRRRQARIRFVGRFKTPEAQTKLRALIRFERAQRRRHND